MKRSGPIKRRTPLKQKGKRRITRGNDEAFLAWLRTRPCDVRRLSRMYVLDVPFCGGRIEAAHYHTRNRTGQDRGNACSLCQVHHRWQHRVGTRTFNHRIGVSLAQLCAEAAAEYEREHDST